MRRRLQHLRTAIILAVGFIGLRVVYRVLFGGAGGDGVTLFVLPRVILPGPFSHIALFGPVTTSGIVSAAASALPFAALVLAFGLLAVIVDIRALLTRGAVRGPIRTVARSLVVAWATFPALLDSVRRVRVARELRGERGAASLVVPVLEQTVERAIALGASMEVRGFAASGRAVPACERPATFVGASLGFDGRWALEGIDLSFGLGTLTLVSGATGSGKSTLLHAMSGLFQHVSDGEQRGTVEVAGVDRVSVPPRETAGFVGVVSQSVRLSFVAGSVADEIGFAMAIRRVAPIIVASRVTEVAHRLGIEALLEREVTALSAGEACLVAIGAALVIEPVLLLVDEPLADLDASARRRVIGMLDQLAHEGGVCVVVAEHALGDWGTVPDTRLEISDGRVQSAGIPAVSGWADEAHSPLSVDVPAMPVADIRNLSVSHGDRRAVDDASLTLFGGEIAALTGPNGAGKSSLLYAMARPAVAGAVTVAGVDVHSLARGPRRAAIALVPEAFEDLLFSTSVAEECRRADRRVPGARTAVLFSQLIGAGGTGDERELLARHPRDLSAGERLCLVIAIQLSARPTVLLVDEPSRGLDAEARRLVGEALLLAASGGTAVVMATHDREFAGRYSTRSITMADGRIATRVGAAR
ncbi:hypothetical protein BH09ACT6_BH09ACT6_17960 [soil metagenome]